MSDGPSNYSSLREEWSLLVHSFLDQQPEEKNFTSLFLAPSFGGALEVPGELPALLLDKIELVASFFLRFAIPTAKGGVKFILD